MKMKKGFIFLMVETIQGSSTGRAEPLGPLTDQRVKPLCPLIDQRPGILNFLRPVGLLD